MGQIQSNFGLVTGFPIVDTVDQLISISARPRDLVIARNEQLKAEQIALAQLSSLLLSFKLSTKQLANSSVFQAKTANSSNTSLLTAAISTDGNPALGSYQFTPVRRAQNQQLLSSPFATKDQSIGAGSLTFQFGGFLDRGIDLRQLNDGAGVQRGEIHITDRSGASAVIDLRFAQSTDDVLTAINNNNNINVTAVADDDSFKLIDNTGQTVSNLIVQEVQSGTTAADLGLSGINTNQNEATGQDVVGLHGNLKLAHLNGGNGVSFNNGLADLNVTFLDGSPDLQIELDSTSAASSATTNATNGDSARIVFTAIQEGTEANDVEIVFADTATAGSETYVYDDSDPQNKTLTIGIESGVSTANQVIAALSATGNETAAALFTAQAFSDGLGVVTDNDSGTFGGGDDSVVATNDLTIDYLIEKINSADPSRLSANISVDGDYIEVNDHTVGGGTFSVSSLFGGTLAEDLGLAEKQVSASFGGTISTDRLQPGLHGALLRNLKGGFGIGTLGEIELTDRSGVSNLNVDLSSAETLQDVVGIVNGAGVGISARINDARNGLILEDTSNGTGNLIVANGDTENSADALGITVNATTDSIDSGSLDLRFISERTLLSSLHGGRGVELGSFIITDTNGAEGAVKLDEVGSEITTIGGVIDAINATGIGVQARINDTGDGIVLIDTALGAGTLSVREVNGTTAADLNIVGDAVEQNVGGSLVDAIDGSTRINVIIDGDDTLDDLITKINELDTAVVATSVFDGQGHRLSLVNQVGGQANELLFDTSGADFVLQEIAKAQDALLSYGPPEIAATSILVSSATNSFTSLVDGLDVTIVGAGDESVTVDVTSTDSDLIDTVNGFVTAFNAIRDNLDEVTVFNEVDNTIGILFGSNETLRVETELSSLLTGTFFGLGTFQSLEEIGIEFTDSGKLTLDNDKLTAAFNEDPEALEQFFSDETLGVAAKLDALLDSLAGDDTSLLDISSDTLSDKIEDNDDRIEFLNDRLEVQRQQLLNQFFQMERIVAQLQNSLTALNSLSIVPPLTVSNSNRN